MRCHGWPLRDAARQRQRGRADGAAPALCAVPHDILLFNPVPTNTLGAAAQDLLRTSAISHCSHRKSATSGAKRQERKQTIVAAPRGCIMRNL
jgi:hypothetical protein